MTDASDRHKLLLATYPREFGSPEDAIDSHIVGAYRPSAPPLGGETSIACIGSCFAGEIAAELTAQGRLVAHMSLSERWNTPHALAHFLRYALNGVPFPDGFLPQDFKLESDLYQTQLSKADAFIMTLGLSVVWTETETGKMVLEPRLGHSAKGLMAGLRGTHAMRQLDLYEIEAEIVAGIECIRSAKPNAPIILTLSPIPFLVSFTPQPPIPSNIISKAALRLALHNIWEQKYPNVYYWPAYDIVEWRAKYERIYGTGEDDARHIKRSVVTDIMSRFSALFIRA